MLVVVATAAADTQISREDKRVRDVSVCVLPFGSAEETRARFESLYERARVITATDKLEGCHLAVFPSEWLEDENAFANMRGEIERWVRAGGALLVFQPNPIADDEVTIELLGTWFRVHNWYEAADAAVKQIDHPIVANLKPRELSFPADRITAFDAKHWTAIVRGSKSRSASLIVGTFGKGRVAIDSDNPNGRDKSVGPEARHTDAFVRALVGWLVERKPARAASPP